MNILIAIVLVLWVSFCFCVLGWFFYSRWRMALRALRSERGFDRSYPLCLMAVVTVLVVASTISRFL